MVTEVHVYCGIVYFLFVCCSVIINTLLLIVLIKGNKEFKTSSFFLLTWQLLIFDWCALVCHLCLAVPTTIAGHEIYSEFLNYFFCMFDKISYNGTLIFAFILTINRFLVFVFPKINDRIFGSPEIFYTIAAGWILLIAFVAAMTFGKNLNFFDSTTFRIILVKLPDRPWYSHNITEPLADGFSQFTPWIMMAIYFITFLEIKFHFYRRCRYGGGSFKKPTTKSKGELKILLQCFIICFVFQIEWLTFNYLPTVARWLPVIEPYVSTISSCMMVCMNTIHSIVVFTFTSKARLLLLSLFNRTRVQVWNSSSLMTVRKSLSK